MNEVPSAGESGVFKVPNFAEVDRRRPTIASITADTYAAVLAGGRGTRLAQLTSWRAKPAVPFGGKHRIIDFALSNCINSGVRRIGVATQYKAHSLIQHLRRGWNFLDSHRQEFLDLLPAQQRVREGWYDGTADALYQNIDILRMQSPRHVLVLAGDHVYKMDYGQMLAEHVERGADLSIACIELRDWEQGADLDSVKIAGSDLFVNDSLYYSHLQSLSTPFALRLNFHDPLVPFRMPSHLHELAVGGFASYIVAAASGGIEPRCKAADCRSR